jgi:transmembrane protein EpsG
MIYITMYLSILLFSIFEFFNRNKHKSLIIVLFIFLFIISGFRYYVGTDYASYLSIFRYSNSISSYSHLEIGFRFLNFVFFTIGINEVYYFTFYAGITLIFFLIPLYFNKE